MAAEIERTLIAARYSSRELSKMLHALYLAGDDPLDRHRRVRREGRAGAHHRHHVDGNAAARRARPARPAVTRTLDTLDAKRRRRGWTASLRAERSRLERLRWVARLKVAVIALVAAVALGAVAYAAKKYLPELLRRPPQPRDAGHQEPGGARDLDAGGEARRGSGEGDEEARPEHAQDEGPRARGGNARRDGGEGGRGRADAAVARVGGARPTPSYFRRSIASCSFASAAFQLGQLRLVLLDDHGGRARHVVRIDELAFHVGDVALELHLVLQQLPSSTFVIDQALERHHHLDVARHRHRRLVEHELAREAGAAAPHAHVAALRLLGDEGLVPFEDGLLVVVVDREQDRQPRGGRDVAFGADAADGDDDLLHQRHRRLGRVVVEAHVTHRIERDHDALRGARRPSAAAARSPR